MLACKAKSIRKMSYQHLCTCLCYHNCTPWGIPGQSSAADFRCWRQAGTSYSLISAWSTFHDKIFIGQDLLFWVTFEDFLVIETGLKQETSSFNLKHCHIIRFRPVLIAWSKTSSLLKSSALLVRCLGVEHKKNANAIVTSFMFLFADHGDVRRRVQSHSPVPRKSSIRSEDGRLEAEDVLEEYRTTHPQEDRYFGCLPVFVPRLQKSLRTQCGSSLARQGKRCSFKWRGRFEEWRWFVWRAWDRPLGFEWTRATGTTQRRIRRVPSRHCGPRHLGNALRWQGASQEPGMYICISQ